MTTQFPEHGQRITLQLDGMGRLGEAIASIDGKPVFVFGGLPGEKVEVEIIRERRRYIAAEVIKVIKPSPYRQQAPCKYFGQCTGCQWQNVVYSHLSSLQGKCGETTQVAVRSSPTTGSYLIQPTLKNLPGPPETGQKSYIESAMGVDFRVGSPSFFQVNIQQLENLANLVKQELNLDGTQVIVDAYAGVGTFSALLAPFSRKVLAIEESAAAIDDAELNLGGFRLSKACLRCNYAASSKTPRICFVRPRIFSP